MSEAIESTRRMQRYLQGVISDAHHHAEKVENIVTTLAGAVMLYKDEDKPIRVYTHNGNVANVAWVWFKGQKYSFSYDYGTHRILFKKNGLQGTTVRAFNNNTGVEEVMDYFERLSDYKREPD